MIVCGYNNAGMFQDVEIISLDGSGEECMNPIDSPVGNFGMSGVYFDGHPIICGGLESGVGARADCYKYNSQVSAKKFKLMM